MSRNLSNLLQFILIVVAFVSIMVSKPTTIEVYNWTTGKYITTYQSKEVPHNYVYIEGGKRVALHYKNHFEGVYAHTDALNEINMSYQTPQTTAEQAFIVLWFFFTATWFMIKHGDKEFDAVWDVIAAFFSFVSYWFSELYLNNNGKATN